MRRPQPAANLAAALAHAEGLIAAVIAEGVIGIRFTNLAPDYV